MDDQGEARPPDYFRIRGRSDMALMRRAARSNWGVPDVLRTEALYRAAEMLADDEADPRVRLAAMRLLATFDVADAAHARVELARLKLAKPEAIDARSALLDEAEELLRADERQGPDPGDPRRLP